MPCKVEADGNGDKVVRHALVGALLLSAAQVTGRPAAAATLSVEVAGVASDVGDVLVAVCTDKTFLTANCPFTGSAPARAGTVEVTIGDVPPGTYAVQAFHDANANMDLDRTFIGFPKEGLGFSNDAPMRFGPPTFADAAIDVAATGASAAFTLSYFRAP